MKLWQLWCCLLGANAFKLSKEDDSLKDSLADSLASWGQYADLAVAFPLAIRNLTNYTGLLAAHDSDSSNITFKFGQSLED